MAMTILCCFCWIYNIWLTIGLDLDLNKLKHAISSASETLDRLRYYETVNIADHRHSFPYIDDLRSAIYPMNGRIEFYAFGRHYVLALRKNVELVSKDFKYVKHDVDNGHDQQHVALDLHECQYTAQVISDASNASAARISLCQGYGIHGWIYAFNETIAIRPKLWMRNARMQRKHSRHRITAQHVVYRYRDVDRSDYSSAYNDNIDVVHSYGDHDHPSTSQANTNNKTKKSSTTNDAMIDSAIRTIERRLITDTGTRRYVELAIVFDPGMWERYNGEMSDMALLGLYAISAVQYFYFYGGWGSNVGRVQVVLSHVGYIPAFSGSGLAQPYTQCQPSLFTSTDYPSLYGSASDASNAYCEVSVITYLNAWTQYINNYLSQYDAAHLYTYFDFVIAGESGGDVIGLTNKRSLCDSKAAVIMYTFDSDFVGQITAHELGHQFGFEHDQLLSACQDNSEFIMSASGNPETPYFEWSTCSVSQMQAEIQRFDCLWNVPLEGEYAVCGNGFVEAGEECDCGDFECVLLGDKCCDGTTCQLFAFAQCSNADACCRDCSYAEQGTLCRERDTGNTCDMAEEFCTGDSGACPLDTAHVAGTACELDAEVYPNGRGLCYGGACVTIDQQCRDIFSLFQAAPNGTCGYDPWWQTGESCVQPVQCLFGDSCGASGLPGDGMPCTYVGNSSDVEVSTAQCVNRECRPSEEVYVHKWAILSGWSECNVTCADIESRSGAQTRDVRCVMQNGTVVEDTRCTESTADLNRPSSAKGCICSFCSDEIDVCDMGTCDHFRQTCICDSGWAGTFCDEPPSLSFTGIVSAVYTDAVSGYVVVEKANRCHGTADSLTLSNDSDTLMRIVPVDGVSSLTELLVGSNIGVRWVATGSVQNLAVGLKAVTSSGAELSAIDWPFYVGSGLSRDGQSCVTENGTSVDECNADLSCNDFTFAIPTSAVPGFYQLMIRFNNEFNVRSNVLRVRCNPSVCNSTGHGYCGDDERCACDDGWSGDSCEVSACKDWLFTADSSESDLLNDNFVKPRCFSSQCSDDVSGAVAVSVCGDACSSAHFEGTFCEIPVDYCATLSGDESACVAVSECAYDSARGVCVYRDCFAFTSQLECEGDGGNETTSIVYDDTWPIFCEWIGEDGYCNRITCGGNVLPTCEQNAVRRPLFVSDTSICRAWFCDCSTAANIGDAHWSISTQDTLESRISSGFEFSSIMTASDLLSVPADLDLFTCNSCALACGNGATVDAACTNCDVDCPIETDPFRAGVECKQVFWIAFFRLHMNYDSQIKPNYAAFVELLIADIAYFLGVTDAYISIWKIEGGGDGTVVFFRYLFDTNDRDEARVVGGDVMAFSRTQFRDSSSTALRGFILQYADTSYVFKHCIPDREECDPRQRTSFNLVLLICLLCSFAAELLVYAIWRVARRKIRRAEYEARVNAAKFEQQQLIDDECNATLVGWKDCTRERAKQIAEAKKKQTEIDAEMTKLNEHHQEMETVAPSEVTEATNTNSLFGKHGVVSSLSHETPQQQNFWQHDETYETQLR